MGLETRPFDAAGTASKKNVLVENGILKSYLHNLYTANKSGATSTGNALRMSFKSTPVIGASNLYISPGKNSKEQLISSVKNGIYITRVMAMHSVNPISGDFSVGAAGILIENGCKTTAVRGITIAGNILEMLHSVTAIASDIEFFPHAKSCGAATMLIENLTVSGE